MTHEVAKVTHQEAVLASPGIKWEENIIVNRWGMGIFWARLYNKSVAKNYSSMELVPNKKKREQSLSLTFSMLKLGRIYDSQEGFKAKYFKIYME